MSKFSIRRPAGPTGPVATQTAAPDLVTCEGAPGWSRDAHSELFLAAVTSLVEPTFYEGGASARVDRLRDLVRQVVAVDPLWVARFVPYLRGVLHLRSVAIVVAAEYVAAGGPVGRPVIRAAMARADEPAEMLGYWLSTHGRRLPAAVKRGVADGATSLWTERSALKWDSRGQTVRMADVIELTHPTPRDARQSALFKYLLDTRHNPGDETVDEDVLPTVAARRALLAVPIEDRREALRTAPERLRAAGFTWENIAGWLPGGMDAEAWESAIPQMGYMALLRNLRNFDRAGVSDEVAEKVAATLADPGEVSVSRQLPIRFVSAWKATDSVRWATALEAALEASLANVPTLRGRTLVMVDLSGSMQWAGRGRAGSVAMWETAATFAVALARRAEDAEVVAYSNESVMVPVRSGASALRTVDTFQHLPRMFQGTDTWGTLRRWYDGHDRVVILTDEQAHPGRAPTIEQVPHLVTFNLAGYRAGHAASGPGRVAIGGLNDAAFRLLDTIEQTRSAGWPF